jgi:HK97 family phage major capsid protein
MADNEVVIKDNTIDYAKVAEETARVMEERAEAKAKAEADLLSLIAKERAEAEADAEAKAEAKYKAWAEEKGVPLVMESAELGSGGEKGDVKTFMHWMRTGDEVAARKALQEGTGSEGGFLVPDDFVNRITEKRDNASFPRAMGVNIIQTSRDAIDIPAESTSLSNFSRTAEEAAYTTNDPSFAQNNIIVHKWTKLTKISEELLEDDASNLEEFYARAVGRAMANTEAYFVAIGSGTNQHQGIFEGGTTNGLAFDTSASGTAIKPEELYELFMTLKQGYQSNAAWLMDNLTWAYLLTLRDTSNWAFGSADFANVNTSGGPSVGMLYGKPVFVQDDIPVRADAITSVMVGDPDYYALVERRGLQISRNPYLYQANGQVGFFNTFRQGGAVLVAEAWQGGYTNA